MACYVLFQSFKQTLSCPVCNCLFQDPVTLDCGHSFCQACIKVCDMEREKSKSCPQCGKFSAARKYVPNKTLVQNVDKIKAMEQAIGAHNCTTHVFGTCCIPDCNVQSIDIRMQMCFRHWALLISKMDECLYTDKGHRETPAVTRETENNSKDSGHQVQTQEVSVSGTEKHHYNQEPAQERPTGHSKIKNPSLTVEFPSLSSSRESICSIDRPVSFKHGKASSLSGDSAISMYGDESRSSSPSVPSSSTSSVSEYELDDAKTQNAASSMRFRSHSYSVPTRCTGNFKKAELKQLH